MQLINDTRMTAGYTLGLEPSGRELLVVVLKGTFRIPRTPGDTLRLQEEQAPLAMSDVFHGEPGQSAPKYEFDFAPRKPRCDVLLNGTAYAPRGESTERCTVGIRVGAWRKLFAVVGDRSWISAAGTVRATQPQPFVTLPISYDCAFGGVDAKHEDPAMHAAFAENPSGRGFHRHLVEQWLAGSPLPNTEQLDRPVTSPDADYQPMAFGPVGRHWTSRAGFAGTYDQRWLDEVAPFLPPDFDDRYYQAAPADQQIDPPTEQQLVSLLNLTPEGRCDFVLPRPDVRIQIVSRTGERTEIPAPIDTLLIEPDLERVQVSWRVAHPLRKNLFEVAQVRMTTSDGAE